MEKPSQVIGFGPKHGAPDFWLHCGGEEFEPFGGDVNKKKGGTHVAMEVSSISKVHQWYDAAM